MTLINMVNKAQKLATDNSPLILTAIGVAGTVTTAFLAHNAGIKASIEVGELVENERRMGRPDPDFKLRAQHIWRFYVPAAGVGITTIACIISANRIGSKRAAAMAAAYSISERAFTEYKEKIIEKFGEKKEQHVQDEIRQDRVNRTPTSSQELVVVGSGEVLCFDMHSGRYFTSSMETIKKAANDINYQVIHHYSASLNDFYDKVGLPYVKIGDELGWNSDHLMDILFTTTISDDQRPCFAIDFSVMPTARYNRLN